MYEKESTDLKKFKPSDNSSKDKPRWKVISNQLKVKWEQIKLIRKSNFAQFFLFWLSNNNNKTKPNKNEIDYLYAW